MDESSDALAAGTDDEDCPKYSESSPADPELVLARGQVSAGAVEGLNNKVKLVTRRSYVFRTARVAKLALSHNRAQLSEPNRPQRFC